MAEAAAPKKEKKNIEPYKPGKSCPKCGSRMGDHSDRFACGNCGYTEWKKQNEKGDIPAKKS